MQRRTLQIVLLGFCWAGPALAQAPAVCKTMMDTRQAGLQEAVRLCSGAGNDALTCYDGARRFIRTNEAFLTLQDVLKCADADITGLRGELVWARGVVNTRAAAARRILLAQTLVDRLFVLSVNTLKSYVCLAMINHHVGTDIAPEYRHNQLVEETLPQTVREGQQVITFKNKTFGRVCGSVDLPAKGQLGAFEDKLFFLAKSRIAESGAAIAREFLPGGGAGAANRQELARQFLALVSDYQVEFERELKRREGEFDVVGLLAKRLPGSPPLVIDAEAPVPEALETFHTKAWRDYGTFLKWTETAILK